jgi:DNA-binding protein YbaB
MKILTNKQFKEMQSEMIKMQDEIKELKFMQNSHNINRIYNELKVEKLIREVAKTL